MRDAQSVSHNPTPPIPYRGRKTSSSFVPSRRQQPLLSAAHHSPSTRPDVTHPVPPVHSPLLRHLPCVAPHAHPSARRSYAFQSFQSTVKAGHLASQPDRVAQTSHRRAPSQVRLPVPLSRIRPPCTTRSPPSHPLPPVFPMSWKCTRRKCMHFQTHHVCVQVAQAAATIQLRRHLRRSPA